MSEDRRCIIPWIKRFRWTLLMVFIMVHLSLLILGGWFWFFYAPSSVDAGASGSGNILRSVENLKSLYLAEKKIISKAQGLLDNCGQMLEKCRREHEAGGLDAEVHVSNPLNSFRLIRRLTIHWRQLKELMLQAEDLLDVDEILTFPTGEDLDSAAETIVALQDFYDLDTKTLAKGTLPGSPGFELIGADCVLLAGQALQRIDDKRRFLSWMQEAAERVSRDEAYSSLEMNRVFFASLLSSNADSAAPLVGESRVVIATKADLDEFTDADHYANMCRGRVRVEEHIERQLHCRRYTNDGHPYLRLMPVNMEEMSLDPLLVVFHDVMLPNEIKIFKQLSRPQFTISTVSAERNFRSNRRLSQTAFLKVKGKETESEYKTLWKYRLRIEAITGLAVSKHWEDFQVVQYGIGGYYSPHHDYFPDMERGNRVSTWLAYMTDVTAGGFTVFPHLNVTLRPEKGSAAFWYNLRRNGDPLNETLHAGCPVLVGDKWIVTQWIREHGQEFSRPCALDKTL